MKQWIVVGAWVMVGLVRLAGADKLDDLVRQLSDGDAKIRLAATLALSRSGSQRAVAPLCGALGDKDKTVRAVASSGLARLVDSSTEAGARDRAIAELRRMAQADPDSFVRGQAQKAFDALAPLGSGGSGSRMAGKKFFVAVGSFDGPHEGQLGELARVRIEKAISAHPQFFTSWPGGGAPGPADLAALAGSFYLEGRVTVASDRQPSTTKIECRAQVTIATFVDRSIRATVTPDRAKAQVEAGGTATDEAAGRKACVEALFDDLIQRRILPFMQVYKQ